MKEAWDNISPVSDENCFRKANISIEYHEEMRPAQDIVGNELIYQLVEEMEELTVDDINGFIHADDADSAEYINAIKDDINDLTEEVHQSQVLLEEESDEEEERDGERANMDDMHLLVASMTCLLIYYHLVQRFITQISRNSQWDSIKKYVVHMRIYYL